MLKVSIIVLCRDQWPLTRRCLEAVRRSTDASRYEVLVYDNASRDATPSGLRRLAKGWPQLRVFRNVRNLSFAEANNLGMRAARGGYFLWLNNDTVVAPGWLEGLLEAVESSEGAAAAGPMTDHQAPPRQIGRPFRTRASARAAEVPFLGGFCFLLKREAVERTGFLDERFVWGWEDMDYCMRLRQGGRRLILARDVFVRHAGSRTLSAMVPAERRRLDVGNRRLMLEKWVEAEPWRADLRALYAELPAPWQRLSPKASILVACRDGNRALACLAALRRSGDLSDCEVLALNLGEDARLSRRLESAAGDWTELKVLGPWPDSGLAKALNRAAVSAKADYLAVVDESTVVEPGWLEALVRRARVRPDAGVVRPEAACGREPTAFLAPRDAFAKVGGFDERFGGELVVADYLFRVLQAGRTVLEADGARAAARGKPREERSRDRRLAAGKWLDFGGSLRSDFWKELGGRPLVSVLALCRGSWSETRRRLEALRGALGDGENYEVVAALLDPPPGVESRSRALAERWPRLRVFGPWGERSLAAGLNRAAAFAHGEFLAVLGEDAVPPSGWLEGLLGTARDRPGAGAARPVDDAGLKTGFLVARSAFERLGGFDERFSGELCARDYFLRLRQAGLDVIDSPALGGRAAGSAEPEAVRLGDRRLAAGKWLDAGLRERFRGELGSGPEVSVLLVCRGRWEDSRRRLDTLRRAAGKADYEVLAAFTDSSADIASRIQRLSERWPRLRPLGPWSGRSLAASLNRAALQAHGEYLAVLGDRAIPGADWLEGLLHAARARTDAGVVTPQGEPLELGFLTPRGVFERLGGFDERFGGEACAWDYFLRARHAGLSRQDAEAARVRSAAPAENEARRLEDRRLLVSKWADFGASGAAELFVERAGSRPAASVIVICRGRWENSRARLKELRRALEGGIDHEVLAGAFGADARTVAELRTLEAGWPRFRFIGAWPSTPYAHVLNLASRAALGEHLLFLGHDASVKPGFLSVLLEAAAKAGPAAVVGSGPQAHNAVSEHCVLIPREVFACIGGFDRRFKRDLWARDFCFRARQRGYEVATADPALVGRTIAALRNGDAESLAHDRKLMFGKWSGHPLFETAR